MVVIIGANSAGSFAGYNLKRLNKATDVNIFEEHPHFKKTCSGIVTSSINILEKQGIKLKSDLVINKIQKVKIHSPNNKFLEINFRKPDLILDKEKFNQHLLEKAIEKGCNFYPKHRFLGIENNNIKIHDLKNSRIKSIKTKHLIGADGSLSNVAKSSGIFSKRIFFTGIKAKMKMKNNNEIEFFPYIKDIAWIIPIDENTVEIGIAARKNAPLIFDNFAKRFSKRIYEKEAALIPLYNGKIKTYKKINGMNIYLAGDSAAQVKATTLGGIIPGLNASIDLANAIIKNKNYEKLWKKRIGKELYMHLMMRKIFDNFNYRDWNSLIENFNDENLKKIIESHSRDEMNKAAVKLFLRKPSLIRFAGKMF